jgi:putative transcriptional regulator
MSRENRILQGAREALAIAEEKAPAGEYAVHVPENVDVRRIREKLRMSQPEFAGAFGFKLATLRHWEQKKRTPEGSARAYLLVIDREPEMVRRTLYDQGESGRAVGR